MAKGPWVVRPRNAEASTKGVRLVRAEKRNQVEGFVLQDWEITRATPEQTHELGKQGVEIEDVE
jgi:hypothetical protein